MAGVDVFPRHFRRKEQAISEIIEEGYRPVPWTDEPGASYEPHRHAEDETLYIVSGSMDFTDLETGRTHHLEPGDKLVLPAETRHSARTREGASYIMGIRTAERGRS
jgi:quercetin dioxygenase-like cupin family protein